MLTLFSYKGLSYGPWLYAGASTIDGGTLSASHSNSISNSYTGTLNTTVKAVNASVGFQITKNSTEIVSFTSNPYPKIAGKGHRLQYRHVYKRYSVKQERKYDRRASVVCGTAYVYPRQWVERQYRVVTFNR